MTIQRIVDLDSRVYSIYILSYHSWYEFWLHVKTFFGKLNDWKAWRNLSCPETLQRCQSCILLWFDQKATVFKCDYFPYTCQISGLHVITYSFCFTKKKFQDRFPPHNFERFENPDFLPVLGPTVAKPPGTQHQSNSIDCFSAHDSFGRPGG